MTGDHSTFGEGAQSPGMCVREVSGGDWRWECEGGQGFSRSPALPGAHPFGVEGVGRFDYFLVDLRRSINMKSGRRGRGEHHSYASDRSVSL